MIDNEEVDDGGAAQAFDALRAEVSAMHRAVERLTADRAGDGQAPDYSETLGVIAANVTATARAVDALAKSPALSLPPAEIGRQITAAGFDARREDHRLFAAARQGMEEVAARLGRHLQSDIAAAEQRRRLWQVGLAGIVAGMVLWAVLAGPIARIMPASWLVPERMAARSLRMPMWEGGQWLMRAGNPQAYAGVLAGNRLVVDNREALEECQKRADRKRDPVICPVQVAPEEKP